MPSKKYGKLVDGAVRYAPVPLIIDGMPVFTNQDDLYLLRGYKPIFTHPQPEEIEGYTLSSVWVETGEMIELVWEQIEDVQNEDDPTNIIDILTGEVE